MYKYFWHIWKIPALLALLSMIGLISALLENGVWDVLSWITLGIPLLVIAFFWGKPREPQRPAK